MSAEVHAQILRLMRMMRHKETTDLGVIFPVAFNAIGDVRVMITEYPNELLDAFDNRVQQRRIGLREPLICVYIVKAVAQRHNPFRSIISNYSGEAGQAVACVISRQRHMAVHLQEAGFLEMQIRHA